AAGLPATGQHYRKPRRHYRRGALKIPGRLIEKRFRLSDGLVTENRARLGIIRGHDLLDARFVVNIVEVGLINNFILAVTLYLARGSYQPGTKVFHLAHVGFIAHSGDGLVASLASKDANGVSRHLSD